MTTKELRYRFCSIRSTGCLKELQELGSGSRWEVLRGMRNDVCVLASTIYIRQMESYRDTTRIGIRVSVWDLRKTG
jgi:hypothetical protein